MDALFERMNEASLNYVPTTPNDIDHLIETIRTRILGVPPACQDVELVDDNWHLILKALRTLNVCMP